MLSCILSFYIFLYISNGLHATSLEIQPQNSGKLIAANLNLNFAGCYKIRVYVMLASPLAVEYVLFTKIYHNFRCTWNFFAFR